MLNYKRREKKVEELEQKGVQELERISGLTSEQAKDELLRRLLKTMSRHDAARLYKELENRAKEEADKKAKEYVVNGYSEMCSRSCGRDYDFCCTASEVMR